MDVEKPEAYVPGAIDALIIALAIIGIGIVGYEVLRGVAWAMYHAAAFFNPWLPWA